MTLIVSQGTVFEVDGRWVLERHHLVLGCQVTAFSDDETVVRISFCQPGIPMESVWCRFDQLPEWFVRAARQLDPERVVSDAAPNGFLCSYDAVDSTLAVERIYYGNNPRCFATEAEARLSL